MKHSKKPEEIVRHIETLRCTTMTFHSLTELHKNIGKLSSKEFEFCRNELEWKKRPWVVIVRTPAIPPHEGVGINITSHDVPSSIH